MSERKYTWREIWSHLWPFVRRYRRDILVVLLLTAVATGVDLLEPLVYKNVLNDLAGVFIHKSVEPEAGADSEDIADFVAATLEKHGPGRIAQRTPEQAFHSLLIAAILLLVINLVYHACTLLADYVSNRYSSRLEQDFIGKLYAHVLKLKLPYLSRRSSAALARQVDQTDSVGPAVTTILQEISSQSFRIVGAIGIMLTRSPVLSLVALAALPVYAVIARKMANRLESSSESYYREWDHVSEHLNSALANIKTVKVSGAEARLTGTFESTLRNVNETFLERDRVEGYYIFAQTAVMQFGKFAVLAYGSWKVIEHQLTPGDVVMFVSLLDKLFDPVDELAERLAALQAEKVSISRGLRLLHARAIEPEGKPVSIGTGEIEFKDVDFSYVKGQKVLDRLSLRIPGGRITALVGPSGSGKTTIADLILRFYELDAGLILLDGQDVASLDASSVRANVGTVLADGAVFRGSLRDNIVFRAPHARKKDIERAVVESGLGPLVTKLPKGLRTPIGEDGVGLSVGERQRLQIARILVAPPKVIILDEATANLDYATESEIRKALLKLKGSCTIVMIAHRASMVENADHVIVLGKGTVEAEGSIDQVRESSSWFDAMMKQRTTGRSAV